MSTSVANRWAATCAGLAATSSEAIYADLVARYGEAHRHYHTLRHLTAVLDAVEWLGETEHTAAELLECAGLPHEVRSERLEAVEWLRDNLASGLRKATDMKREAKAAGIALRTLDRAKKELRVRATKDGFHSGWLWELSADEGRSAAEEHEERHETNM